MLRLCPLLLLLPLARAQTPTTPRPLPDLATATRCVDTKTQTDITLPTLLDRLASHDVVFAGETHIDDTTHRVELHLLTELLARKPGRVVLAMEMFERDVQPTLDAYLAGRIDEPAFVQKARAWGNYHTAYRPLVEAAKAAGIPVVAANFPGTLRRPLASGGKAALDKLSAEQRALLPDEIFPASASYWQRVDRAVRGHMGGPGGGTPEERRYETQNLWDNAMGDNVAKALANHPGATVLHVAGGFHVAYRDGTVAQFARRAPQAKFAVVQISPTARAHDARPDRDLQQADFLVYAESHARDENEGNYAVSVPAELRYRLHVAEHGKDQPLLVWLPDRGSRTGDAEALWRAALGDGAAVAVVEAPFPELQPDLALGGRYAVGDGFRADYGRVSLGLARLVEWVTRRYPVDARRIVVAGQGEGATAVLWTALYGEWLDAEFVAIDPQDLGRLGMEALPDQAPVAKSLQLVSQRVPQDRLAPIAADFTKIRLATTVTALQADDPLATCGLLAAKFGKTLPMGSDTPRTLALAADLPRGREWAALHQLLQLRGGQATVLAAPGTDGAQVLEVGGTGPFPVASFANGRGLPLAGGPFGGTTVVVLPKGTSDADRAAWLDHEKNKVLKQRSMFANLAVAMADGAPSLAEVITQLKARGRSRFLVVPAVFCAGPEWMQHLQRELGEAGEGCDLAWLPGLGAELAGLAH
jgi:uncharacterized iron-regulated protein